MGPMLLLDKSVINGLSNAHCSLLHRYYSPVISPVLIREILSNLAKKETIEASKELVAGLATRTHGIHSWVSPARS